MIQAHMLTGGAIVIVADQVPQSGTTIHVEEFGECRVIRLYHTDNNNYITLRRLEDSYMFSAPFAMKG